MTLRSKSTSSSVYVKELTASLSVVFGVWFDLDVLKLISSGKARAEQTEQIYRHYSAFYDYGTCSEYILLQGAMIPRVNPYTIECVWMGKFDLNTLYVWTGPEIFESRKKKLRIQKYPATFGRGLPGLRFGLLLIAVFIPLDFLLSE